MVKNEEVTNRWLIATFREQAQSAVLTLQDISSIASFVMYKLGSTLGYHR